ncbi:hypothetical protein TL16_g08536 [Triparma laevis f. inornata]|uniref:Uncharacterized protein n=1 Tax=Triparma laevis f. inornata TaxID=1714386 RepID=A0A9W7AYJ0_9STRA|nr:hypothetical protein TL16_g08536 [Triparma laevis f. inornata]
MLRPADARQQLAAAPAFSPVLLRPHDLEILGDLGKRSESTLPRCPYGRACTNTSFFGSCKWEHPEVRYIDEKSKKEKVRLVKVVGVQTCVPCGLKFPLTARFCSKCGLETTNDGKTHDWVLDRSNNEEKLPGSKSPQAARLIAAVCKSGSNCTFSASVCPNGPGCTQALCKSWHGQECRDGEHCTHFTVNNVGCYFYHGPDGRILDRVLCMDGENCTFQHFRGCRFYHPNGRIMDRKRKKN